jgi:DNA-binding NtrC family response regulator
LPPLREIRDELSWLWETTYDQAAQRAGIAVQRVRLGVAHHRRITADLASHPLPGNLRELFRVAYRIIGARSDPHEPLSPDDAVTYGLATLGETRTRKDDSSVSRAIARRFADASPLDTLLDSAAPIATRVVESDLREFLAKELRRISKTRGVPVEELCDVSERSLRTWGARQRGAGTSS